MGERRGGEGERRGGGGGEGGGGRNRGGEGREREYDVAIFNSLVCFVGWERSVPGACSVKFQGEERGGEDGEKREWGERGRG